jgi:hypothetical protein
LATSVLRAMLTAIPFCSFILVCVCTFGTVHDSEKDNVNEGPVAFVFYLPPSYARRLGSSYSEGTVHVCESLLDNGSARDFAKCVLNESKKQAAIVPGGNRELQSLAVPRVKTTFDGCVFANNSLSQVRPFQFGIAFNGVITAYTQYVDLKVYNSIFQGNVHSNTQERNDVVRG